MYNGYFLFILVVAFGAVYTFCTPAIKVCEDQHLYSKPTDVNIN